MTGRDPLLPNAGIIARREYRDRIRSPLFVVSTIVLAGLAMLVALAPIGIRIVDRQTVTQIAIVSSDADLANRAASVADSVLNVPPPASPTRTSSIPTRSRSRPIRPPPRPA